MSEDIQDYPFTWESSQNSKGFMQIRFKLKDVEPNPNNETVQQVIKDNLINIKKAIEDAGFKIQPAEPIKEKKA